MDEFRERTGIYGLGFNKESFLGLMLPIALVVGVAVVAFGVAFLTSR